MLAATAVTPHDRPTIYRLRDHQTRSPAAEAAQVTIRTARRRVPELVAFFESGAARQLRLILQRPLSAWRFRAAAATQPSTSDANDIDVLFDGFDEVFDAMPPRPLLRTSSAARDERIERDAVVYQGACGDWVELHGEYSLERLRMFDSYAKTTSLARVLAVCCLTPLPNLLVITLMDCVPLASPESGTNANYVHWGRNLFALTLITWSILVQFENMVSGLSITRTRMVVLSIVPSIACICFEYALTLAIGFPLPFAMVVGTPFWSTVLVALLVFYVGDQIRANAQLRTDLGNYMLVFLCQCVLTYIYPAYIYGFRSISESAQTFYIVLLPLLKIVLKNWISKSLGELDDMKPEAVIFNIEIFNALYVACCMQQSASITTSLVISLIDWLQALLSLHDIERKHTNVHAFMARIPSTHAWSGKSFVDVACIVVAEDERVRNSSSLRAACVSTGPTLLSKLRLKKPPRKSSLTHKRQQFVAGARVAPAQTLLNGASSDNKQRTTESIRSPPAAAPKPTSTQDELTEMLRLPTSVHSTAVSAAAAFASEEQRVQFVKSVNQLLFTCEFVVLVEYTEVIVPLIYTLYVIAVYHLENRVHYQQLAHLDATEIQQRVTNVMVYCALELLSFVVVSATLRRRLGVATFKQLALVLEKQSLLVQVKLLLWLLYAVQTSLTHIGADYSFQFKWLREHST